MEFKGLKEFKDIKAHKDLKEIEVFKELLGRELQAFKGIKGFKEVMLQHLARKGIRDRKVRKVIKENLEERKALKVLKDRKDYREIQDQQGMDQSVIEAFKAHKDKMVLVLKVLKALAARRDILEFMAAEVLKERKDILDLQKQVLKAYKGDLASPQVPKVFKA